MLLDPRLIGGAITLIPKLSRSKRHAEAIALAEALYGQRGKSRDLNVLMTAIWAEGNTDSLRDIARRAEAHFRSPTAEYDVQFMANWLRTLYELDDREMFWQLYDRVAEADRTHNAFIVVQTFRMLIRQARYAEVVDQWAHLPPTVQTDDIVRKHAARAFLETGRDLEAAAVLRDTRDDKLKETLLERLADRTRAGGGSAEVRETPGIREHALAGKPAIFVVYGHDPRTRAELESLLFRIGAEPITFETLPKAGSPTVIELLERHIPRADAVVTLLTPDDEGRKLGSSDPLLPRARENVLIEAGYAMISQRDRSILVAIAGVNIPSDFAGILRIEALSWSNEVGLKVAQRLRDMGLAVDPSKAL